jgi:hypothetical protein
LGRRLAAGFGALCFWRKAVRECFDTLFEGKVSGNGFRPLSATGHGRQLTVGDLSIAWLCRQCQVHKRVGVFDDAKPDAWRYFEANFLCDRCRISQESLFESVVLPPATIPTD